MRQTVQDCSVLADLVEHRVLLAGVGPVLELDHAGLGELLAEPAVGGVEQAELLAVRHDLAEQHRLEDLLLRRVVRVEELSDLVRVDAHPLPHLGLHEALLQPARGVERELLALPELGRVESGVELLERQHTERDVACFVAHHVAEQLLEQWLGGDLLHHPERGERQALDHDLHAEVRDVPPRVGEDVVEQRLQVVVDAVLARRASRRGSAANTST